jgi:ribosomal RNA-processing protein 1
MTDRPVAQQRLAADLASLYGALPDGGADAETSNVVVWFAAFWEVLSAQWPHIEALRLDKFLLLVRRIFAAQLAHINSLLLAAGQSRSGDSMASVQQLVDDALAKWCFEPSGDPRSVPLGLRLHVLDIWVDELDAAGLLGTDDEEDGGDNGGEQKKRRGLVVRAVGDLVEALIGCPVKAVRERARESYDDERLPWTTKDPNGDDGAHEDDDGGEWGGIED